MQHQQWMKHALDEAKQAALEGEVPVGAVIVREGELVSTGRNCRQLMGDPTGHAEILALRHAAQTLGGWRLKDCTFYVTLEPCLMCAGALLLARLKKVVFAARDPKGGAVVSLYRVFEDSRLNHTISYVEGVGGEEASALLTEFFRERRKVQAVGENSIGPS